MNDIDQLKENIRQYIRQNGNREITGEILQEILLAMVDELASGGVIDDALSLESENPVQNKAIKAALDGKVSAVPGKALILETLITKLSNMPTITDFNSTTNRIKINNKEYELMPYVPIPDYFVGWTDGTEQSFNDLTDAQLKQIAGTGKYIASASDNPYTGQFGGHEIFFLLYRESRPPQHLYLVSGGQQMEQNINSDDNSFQGHPNVTIDGTSYKLFGIFMPGIAATDSIIINF